MLDIRLIKEEPEKLRDALLKRMDTVDFSSILALDEQSRALKTEIDERRAKRNQISKQIGEGKRNKEDTSSLEAEANDNNNKIQELEEKLGTAYEDLQTQLAELPNIPDDRVKPGGKENNEVVRTWGEKPALSPTAKDHVDLCKDLGLVDYERGVKLGGSGFWLYTGMGAALEWALLNYFCREHFKDGYEFFLPPHLLNHESGYAAGQFPKFGDDVFHLKQQGSDRERFLLPTSETAILNVYRDEIMDVEKLPMKAFAYTPCYRREAGSARTEERGTVRGHQFNKVEMFQFVTPDQSEEALNELVKKAEKLVEDLGLHYQTTQLAAKDASATMALTYDVEVWLPSMGIYKEVSSVSWARDYQARRANIRYKPQGAKKTEFVHTLNASGLATSRLLPAIVEQFQQPDGSVIVPEPLRDWLGVDVLKA